MKRPKAARSKVAASPRLVFDFMFEALQNHAAPRKEKPKQKRKQIPKHATSGLKNIFNPTIIECKKTTHRYTPQRLHRTSKLSWFVNVNSGILTHRACRVENRTIPTTNQSEPQFIEGVNM